MSFIDKLGNSKYLKKESALPTPLLLTIKEICEEDVAMDGEPEKLKQVVYFTEVDKGFVLGKVTGQQIASFLGNPGNDPTPWYGKKIVLYCDPNVTMKGKLVGGLRVRAPRGPAATPMNNRGQQAPQGQQRKDPDWAVGAGQSAPPPEEDDNVNF